MNFAGIDTNADVFDGAVCSNAPTAAEINDTYVEQDTDGANVELDATRISPNRIGEMAEDSDDTAEDWDGSADDWDGTADDRDGTAASATDVINDDACSNAEENESAVVEDWDGQLAATSQQLGESELSQGNLSNYKQMYEQDPSCLENLVQLILSESVKQLSALDVKRLIGLEGNKKAVNQILYALEKRGIARHVGDDPPMWSLVHKHVTTTPALYALNCDNQNSNVQSSFSVPLTPLQILQQKRNSPSSSAGEPYMLGVRVASAPEPAAAAAPRGRGRGRGRLGMQHSYKPYSVPASHSHRDLNTTGAAAGNNSLERSLSLEKDGSGFGALSVDDTVPNYIDNLGMLAEGGDVTSRSAIPPSPRTLLQKSRQINTPQINLYPPTTTRQLVTSQLSARALNTAQPITQLQQSCAGTVAQQPMDVSQSVATTAPQAAAAHVSSEMLKAMNKNAVSVLCEWAQARKMECVISCVNQYGPSHRPK